MAILHRKEEKIQAVLGRLPQNYTDEEFVNMFIKLYSKDWGKIKAAYIKQSQDKEPGTVINMPKPDLYLKQLAEIYIKANPPKATVIKKAPEVVDTPTEKVKKATAKKPAVVEVPPAELKAKKTTVKKEAKPVEASVEKVKKATVKKTITVEQTLAEPKVKKVAVKKKAEIAETPAEEVKKTKAVTKKKATAEEVDTPKKKAAVKK